MSPIKGLTDRGLAFPEIGRIRKGAPKGERRPGKDLDYFRVEFFEGEEEAARLFREHYGDKPRALRVFLPFNEVDRVWDAYLEAYTAGAMVARSDGEIILFLRDPDTGEVIVRDGRRVDTGEVVPYDPTRPVAYYTDTHGRKQPVELKPYGRLKVVVPELRRLAYLTLVTTSTFDIANLSSQLQSLAVVNRGRLAGIPLILKRSPRMVSVPMPDGKRQRMKKWLLSLEAAPDFVEAAIAALAAEAMPALEVAPVAALPSGGEANGEVGPDEPIEAEYTEAPSEPAPAEPQPQGGNGNGNGERPYEPEALRERVALRIRHHRERGFAFADEGKRRGARGILASVLSEILAGPDGSGGKTARHELLEYLVGQASLSEADDATLKALLDWLDPQRPDPDGPYAVAEVAEAEAKAAWRAALAEKGQGALL